MPLPSGSFDCAGFARSAQDDKGQREILRLASLAQDDKGQREILRLGGVAASLRMTELLRLS